MPDIASQPKPPKKGTSIDPVCDNCKWADKINASNYVDCMVDLPPFVIISNDARRYKVIKTYSCGLWKGK